MIHRTGLALRILALSLCTTAFGQALPEAPPAGINPELWSKMQAIDAKAALIHDLTADFEQKKFTALLKDPIVSDGHLFAKGAVMLWDTAKPQPTEMRVDASQIAIYYPQQNSEEIYPLDSQLGSMTASPIPRLAALLGHFHIEPADPQAIGHPLLADALVFKLTPTDDKLRQYVDSVVVAIDADHGYITDFNLTDADGETTDMHFSKVKINTGMTDAQLNLATPPHVRISRPMQGDSGGAAPADNPPSNGKTP